MPEPKLGLTIEGELDRTFGAGEAVRIGGQALLPVRETGEEAASNEAIAWHRALYLTCITAGSQAPLVANLCKDRLILPADLKRVDTPEGPAVAIAISIDVASELGEGALPRGRYFLHLSARQFQSPVLSIEVT
jgi:hypothetical protein